MNFKRLFEECGITPGPWVKDYKNDNNPILRDSMGFEFVSINNFIVSVAEANISLIKQSIELLKALIDLCLGHCETCLGDNCDACDIATEYITLIEKTLSTPERPITWKEIKELLEGE